MDLCTELKALTLSFLTQINTFNSSMLRPCVKWMKALKNFLQTQCVSHFVCLTLAGHFHENLPKISATNIHYKINVCNKLVGISHSCRNCVITGDWDSGIEMTKDLPFTVPLAIFAVHPFQNALKITNHIQGWASIDASCYQLIYIANNHLWSAGKYKDGDASHYSLLHSRNHTMLPHQPCVYSRIVGILRGQISTKGHFGRFVQCVFMIHEFNDLMFDLVGERGSIPSHLLHRHFRTNSTVSLSSSLTLDALHVDQTARIYLPQLKFIFTAIWTHVDDITLGLHCKTTDWQGKKREQAWLPFLTLDSQWMMVGDI